MGEQGDRRNARADLETREALLARLGGRRRDGRGGGMTVARRRIEGAEVLVVRVACGTPLSDVPLSDAPLPDSFRGFRVIYERHAPPVVQGPAL